MMGKTGRDKGICLAFLVLENKLTESVQERKTYVRTNNIKSCERIKAMGGRVLSPILFIMVMDDMKKGHKVKIGCRILEMIKLAECAFASKLVEF